MARTSFFTGFGKSKFWRQASWLEGFKFVLYVGLPIATSVIYANPDIMKDLVLYFNFVKYPEEKPGFSKQQYEALKSQIEAIEAADKVPDSNHGPKSR